MTRLAVLSDIHSAAGAYSAALEDARHEGFDVLILLGDLLTYGPFPERTLELTRSALDNENAILIEGNHDEFYLEREIGGEERPHSTGWIAESIDWTMNRINLDEFARLAWQKEFVIEDLLFAHANPFAFGDWSYLRNDEDFKAATSVLSSRGLRHGIFGHSHRYGRFEERGVTAMTVGSLGQPRSTSDKLAQWTMVMVEPGGIKVDVHRLDYDWREHCDSIRSTDMSNSTKERLCEFFL